MKKITLILSMFITGMLFAQNSATATVNAEIVTPIKIESSGALDFGQIAQDGTAGDVVIKADGSGRNFANSNMEIASSTFTVPTFTVTMSDGQTYGVVTTGDILTETGGGTMDLVNVNTTLPNSTGNTATEFSVGGRLKVGADQAVGSYEGEVSVTVTYE